MTTPGQVAPGALVAQVEAALVDLPAGGAALLAMSGGPDSAGLAALVCQARPDLRLAAVHVRHGLRDDAPDAMAARAQAAALGLRFHEERVVDQEHRGGPEAAARRARYAALRRASEALGAAAVLVGHTADDRAETVLLRIARGTGIGGLGGMAADARVHGVRVLRPLLGLRRSDVRAWVRAAALPVAADPTNADHERPRARARALLPQLDRLAGGPRDAVTTLLRLADLASEDAAALDGLAGEALAGLRRWGPAACVPDSPVAAPRALASRVVRGLVAAAGGLPPAAAAVRAVLELTPGRVVALPGDLRVGRGSGWLVAVPPHAGLTVRTLPPDAALPLPELGLAIATGAAIPDGGPGVPPGAVGSASGVLVGEAPYVVRAPERGDRLPDGRMLADALARSGVPRLLRSLVPVVCDAAGRPLWAPGLRTNAADGAGATGVPVALRTAPATLPAR